MYGQGDLALLNAAFWALMGIPFGVLASRAMRRLLEWWDSRDLRDKEMGE